MPNAKSIFDMLKKDTRIVRHHSRINHTEVLTVLLSLLTLLVGCSAPGTKGQLALNPLILAQNSNYLIIKTRGDNTSRSLAKLYLGDEELFWRIEDANDIAEIKSGQSLVIPLKEVNRTGVYADGYQTIPILCYHKFAGKNHNLTISSKKFRDQMKYLRDNKYRVIPLNDLIEFLQGKRTLPRRSVVLSIDDGHKSIYKIAYPILKEFGFPATVFAYSDYLNNGGLTWQQIDEMVRSGLISVQAHSKSHANLTVQFNGEEEAAYKKRIEDEVRIPTEMLNNKIGKSVYGFSYPYGDADEHLFKLLKRYGYDIGVTVQPGGNAVFHHTYLLHRAMIFGNRDMAAFKSTLKVFESSH